MSTNDPAPSVPEPRTTPQQTGLDRAHDLADAMFTDMLPQDTVGAVMAYAFGNVESARPKKDLISPELAKLIAAYDQAAETRDVTARDHDPYAIPMSYGEFAAAYAPVIHFADNRVLHTRQSISDQLFEPQPDDWTRLNAALGKLHRREKLEEDDIAALEFGKPLLDDMTRRTIAPRAQFAMDEVLDARTVDDKVDADRDEKSHLNITAAVQNFQKRVAAINAALSQGASQEVS